MNPYTIQRMARDLHPEDIPHLNMAELVAASLTMLEPAEHWHEYQGLTERRYPLGDLPEAGNSPLARHLRALTIAIWLEQNNWHDRDDVHEEDLEVMMQTYRDCIEGEDQ